MEDDHHERQEGQRPPELVQEEGVEPLGEPGGDRLDEAGLAPELLDPQHPLGEHVEHRQRLAPASVRERRARARVKQAAVGRTGEKSPHALHPFAEPGIGAHDLDSQLLGEHLIVQSASALLELVRHVEDEQGRDAHLEHGLGEHELRLEPRRVDDQHECIGGAQPLDPALEHVPRHALVEGAGREPVQPRQVHQLHAAVAVQPRHADVLLDGDAGIVGDLLPQPGQPVEEGGLAGVGRPDQRDQRNGRGLRRVGEENAGSRVAGGIGMAPVGQGGHQRIRRRPPVRRPGSHRASRTSTPPSRDGSRVGSRPP